MEKFKIKLLPPFIKGMLTACVLTLIGVYSCEEYYIGKSEEELAREMWEVDSLMKRIQLELDSTAMDFNRLYINAQRINNGHF